MSLENFSSFASCLNEISQSVRKITLNKSNLENNYKIKTDDSPVTKYDIEAENYIRKYLENTFPSHNIIGEELKVIDKKSESTIHPLIYRAKEKSLPYKSLWEKIELLKDYINNQDEYNALQLTKTLVPEWVRSK